jgi:hypothetical protein
MKTTLRYLSLNGQPTQDLEHQLQTRALRRQERGRSQLQLNAIAAGGPKPRPAAEFEGERTTMDDITAYWQKALGKKSVLGQASNRPPARQLAPAPDRLSSMSPSAPANPKQTTSDAPEIAPERQDPKH